MLHELNSVALSSDEAEVIALTKSLKDLRSFKTLLMKL